METVMEEAKEMNTAYVRKQALHEASRLLSALAMANLQLKEAQLAVDQFDEAKYIANYIRANY